MCWVSIGLYFLKHGFQTFISVFYYLENIAAVVTCAWLFGFFFFVSRVADIHVLLTFSFDSELMERTWFSVAFNLFFGVCALYNFICF